MTYHTTAERILATRRVVCPKCHAPAGVNCDGRPQERPHNERQELDAAHERDLRKLKEWNTQCAG